MPNANSSDISCALALYLDLPLTVKTNCTIAKSHSNHEPRFVSLPGNRFFVVSSPDIPQSQNETELKSNSTLLDTLIGDIDMPQAIHCNMCLVTVPCKERISIGGYVIEPTYRHCRPDITTIQVEYVLKLLPILSSYDEDKLSTLNINGDFLFDNSTDREQFLQEWPVVGQDSVMSPSKTFNTDENTSPKVKYVSMDTVIGLFAACVFICSCTVVFILYFKSILLKKDFERCMTEP